MYKYQSVKLSTTTPEYTEYITILSAIELKYNDIVITAHNGRCLILFKMEG